MNDHPGIIQTARRNSVAQKSSVTLTDSHTGPSSFPQTDAVHWAKVPHFFLSKSCSFALLHQGPDCEVRICTVSPARFFTVPDLLCRGRCPLVIFAYDGRRFIDRKETFPRDDERVSHSERKVKNRERSQHISPIPHRSRWLSVAQLRELDETNFPGVIAIFSFFSFSSSSFFLFFFPLSSCALRMAKRKASPQRRINRVAFSPWHFSTDRAKRGPASGQFYLWTGISSGEWAGSRSSLFSWRIVISWGWLGWK